MQLKMKLEWSGQRHNDCASNRSFSGNNQEHQQSWVENPAYEAKVRIPPKSVPASPTTFRKKYRVRVVEDNVDKETAKMVENLKERLKTFDQDLDRVKQAALKIHQDLNSAGPTPDNQVESKVTRNSCCS